MVSRRPLLFAACCAGALVAGGCHESKPPGEQPPSTRSALPLCDLGRLALGLGVAGTEISASTHVHGRRCRLRVTLHVTLYNVNHDPRKVEGNPARLRIDRPIQPGDQIYAAWSWHNWCGKREISDVGVTAANLSTSVRIGAVPRCDDPTAPSTLEQRPLKEFYRD